MSGSTTRGRNLAKVATGTLATVLGVDADGGVEQQAVGALKGKDGAAGKDGAPGTPGAASTVTGPAGLSAFQVAQGAGFTGTQAEWLASFKGAKGDAGPAGTPGTQLQRAILTTDANGLATWTFPTPYAAGTLPVISTDVQDAGADTVTVKVTALSNTTMTVKATKPVLVLTVLGATAAASVKVHVIAAPP